jgi:2-C-methyl-D-erythritol 4-phosphate cytidylyltransferase
MTASFYALIPAAGTGSRLGAEVPKQYTSLRGRQVVEHSLAPFLVQPLIQQVFVVVAPEDDQFSLQHPRVTRLALGGQSRRDTVWNALKALRSTLDADDWVLVHDAARPGLSTEMLQRLIDACQNDEVGGLLALPVPDTLKKADAQGRVEHTIARTALWLAQTPQMFRYARLCEALQRLPSATDESSAIEALGLQPRLVLGDARNFKITYPQDLVHAEHWLELT